MESAIAILKKAVELDRSENYSESLERYHEGIQKLLNIVPELDSNEEKIKMRSKIEGYITRAEKLKKLIEERKNHSPRSVIGNSQTSRNQENRGPQHFTHKQIIIKEDSIGNSYDVIFGSFLDDSVNEIQIDDAYIRAFHQCQNLLRFCALAVRSCKNLRRISLLTTLDDKPAQQEESLRQIQEDLRNRHNVTLDINYSSTLHDREIRLSNGFVMQMGRGLDYFKGPEGKFSLGYHDFYFRKCHETKINIFHEKDVHQSIRED